MKKNIYKYIFLLALTLFLNGCDLLIKDLPKSGISYTPLSYEVESIDYITDVNSDELVWNIIPNESGDTKLTIYAGLTNVKSIKVTDVLIDNKQITLIISGSKIKSHLITRPKISLLVYGLNPFLKNEYKIKIIEDYPTYKLKSSLDETLKYIYKKTNITDKIPISSKLTDDWGDLIWHLNFYYADRDNNFPVKLIDLKFNTTTSDLQYNIINQVSKKIMDDGHILNFIDDNRLLIQSSDGLSCYYIPEKEIIKLNTSLPKISLTALDSDSSELYLYSSQTPKSYYKINSSLEIKKFPTKVNVELKDMAADKNNLLLLSNDNKIYKVNSNKNPFYSNKKDISYIDFKDSLIFEHKDSKNKIFKLENGREFFIDYGENPLYIGNKIVYRSTNSKNENSIYSYDLNTSLKNTIFSGNNISYQKNADRGLLIFEDIGQTYRLSYYEENVSRYLCDIPKTEAFYSKKYNQIYINYLDSIIQIDLNYSPQI